MKLDSEQQRSQLLQILRATPLQGPFDVLRQTAAELGRLEAAIMVAGVECLLDSVNPWARVKTEKKELDDKIEKLVAFLGTLQYASLGMQSQDLLQQQLFVMAKYSEILGTRIKNEEVKNEAGKE